jgi:uncharacterized protein (DUF1330 family)
MAIIVAMGLIVPVSAFFKSAGAEPMVREGDTNAVINVDNIIIKFYSRNRLRFSGKMCF